jgi:hypothetical protein
LNGDRNGSPHGAPGQSTPFSSGDENEQGTGWDTPRTPDFGVPATDVKVAGTPAAAATALLPSGPLSHDERPRDEVADEDGFRPSGRRTVTLPGRLVLPRIAVVATAAAVVVGGGAVAAFALSSGSDGKSGSASVSPSKPAAAAADSADDPAIKQAIEAAARREALDRASKAARKDSGKRPVLAVKGTPLPTATPSTAYGGGTGGGGGDPVPAGQAQQIAKAMLPSFGFSGAGQFNCLVNLWNRESHWNVHAGNPTSGAYGIPQALPGTKMASAGPNWHDDARTQIKWGLGYIKSRYSTPCGGWAHFQSHNWY